MPVQSNTEHAVLIRVRNAPELARSQGWMASIAQSLVPSTVEGKVYSELATQLGEALRGKNVDAEVSIVDPKGWTDASWKNLGVDLAIGAGVIGLAALVSWKISTKGKKK